MHETRRLTAAPFLPSQQSGRTPHTPHVCARGPSQAGGGVAMNYGGILELEDSLISYTYGWNTAAVMAARASRAIIRRTRIEHSSTYKNGAVSIIAASLEMEGTTIYDTVSMMRYGSLYVSVTSSTADVRDSLFERARTKELGGCLFVRDAKDVRMHNVTMRDCVATDTAGAVHVTSGNLHLSAVTIEDASAGEHGGAMLVEGGMVTIDSSVVQRSAAMSGGALSVAGGEVLVRGSTLFANRQAVRQVNGQLTLEGSLVSGGSGACVSMEGWGAVMTLNRSNITGCTGEGVGAGGADLTGGALLELHDSTVSRCVSGFQGGGLNVGPGSRVLMARSVIDHCSASQRGGGAFVQGSLELTDDSSIRSCDASNMGGGLLVAHNGVASLTDSDIVDCHVRVTSLADFAEERLAVIPPYGNGGCAEVQERGTLRLFKSALVGCTSPTTAHHLREKDWLGHANGLYVHAGASLMTGEVRLVPSCTSTITFNASMPYIGAHAQAALTLRGVRLVPSPECAPTLPPASRLIGDGTIPAPCSQATCMPHAACTEAPIDERVSADNALVLTPVCTCEAPNIPHPLAPSALLAPYSHGCATPRRGSSARVETSTAESLVVTMTKPLASMHTLIVSLEGTADAPATWAVDPSSIPSWLTVSPLTASLAADELHARLNLTLSSAALRVQDSPYRATLAITITSTQTVVLRPRVFLFVASTDDDTPGLSTAAVAVIIVVMALITLTILGVVWRMWSVRRARLRAEATAARDKLVERRMMALTCHEVRNPLNGVRDPCACCVAALPLRYRSLLISTARAWRHRRSSCTTEAPPLCLKRPPLHSRAAAVVSLVSAAVCGCRSHLCAPPCGHAPAPAHDCWSYALAQVPSMRSGS